MVNENYSVTLDSEIVEEAKKYYTDFGGKLSPLLNKLLKNWNVIQRSNAKELPKKQKKNIDKDLDIDLDLTGDIE